MTKKELEQRLADIKAIYAQATPQMKQVLWKEAKQIKRSLSHLCYECKDSEMTEIHLPFCSADCHEKYADRELKPKKGQGKYISYMQERLREMGREAVKHGKA